MVPRTEMLDLIVIDEFHHAAAPTYRRIIEHFRPPFLLGLTATPQRMDGADLLALCGDNLVFECGLVEGISRGELCRFEYRAERDVADFAHVPWRNGRFDPEALAGAIETIDRAEQELEVWREHGRTRTLAFCCSITHAEFMSAFFNEHDVRAVAVHSAARSSDRRAALERLNAGELDIVFGSYDHNIYALRTRPARGARQRGAGGHRLHRQPPQLPVQASDAAQPYELGLRVDGGGDRGNADR